MTIELATSFIFLVTTFYGPATSVAEVNQTAVDKQISQPKEEMTINGPVTLENYVKDYFKDEPVLADIARCESQYRQFGKTGQIIRGKVNQYDIGIMQINEKYHAEQAEKNGFDLYTLEGNMAYGKWLYEKEGVTPWMSSSKCWKNGDVQIAIAK